MASYWACLLLLVAVASAVPLQTPQQSPQQTPQKTSLETPQPHEQAITQAIDFYNQGPTVTYAFRLLFAAPPPQVAQDQAANPLQQLNFTIMETTCLASAYPVVEQCAFKENGLVRDCSGHFSNQEACPVVAITCDVAPPRVSFPTR
uniref:Cathelicidin-2-like n=1 Tax=Pelodiscus sinensis TaxID=13735 RepID=K7GI28_PELSI|nr:cathelicidin-2-like [Pelodiscus sinensis]|eukprot:XP_006114484.1 cathelicidin-2-like [Pelodiscus sinensis]